MQLHRQSKVRTSENSLLFIFPTNKTKVLHFPQSPPPQKKPKTKQKSRMATQTQHGSGLCLHFSCSALGFTSATFKGKKKKHKTKKVQKRNPKWCAAEEPSGDKLVLGRGAALGGRVCVRLVADDHFRRDAQPLFDNTASKKIKTKKIER